MDTNMISIAIPIHDMENGDYFLSRLLNSLQQQTFRDFEIVITKQGKMAENTNEAIRRSKGDLIKILYMDDYLAHPNALQEIVDAFKGDWLVTGCQHDDGSSISRPHYPTYNDRIHEGYNTIGSPSVLTIRNGLDMFFDEKMSWLLDGDFYKRMYEKHGYPTILNDLNVNIGVGEHQMTNILTDEEKEQENNYIKNKYE